MGCVAWGGCHCIKNFHKDSDFIFSPHILKGKSKKFLGYINENLDSAKYLIYIDINCSRCSTRIKRIYNLTRNIIIPNGSILYNPPL